MNKALYLVLGLFLAATELNAQEFPFLTPGQDIPSVLTENPADISPAGEAQVRTSIVQRVAVSRSPIQVDSDGDGVDDEFDIDDDNDGVLDTEEKDCAIDLGSFNYSGVAIDSYSSTEMTLSNTSAWRSSYSNTALSLPIHFEFRVTASGGYGMLGLIPVTEQQTPNNWNDGAYKYFMSPNQLLR